MTEMSKSWEWRRASGGSVPGGDRTVFHAYGTNDQAACAPGYGLAASCEEPNEGSKFCPDCMGIVRATPSGGEPALPKAKLYFAPEGYGEGTYHVGPEQHYPPFRATGYLNAEDVKISWRPSGA